MIMLKSDGLVASYSFRVFVGQNIDNFSFRSTTEYTFSKIFAEQIRVYGSFQICMIGLGKMALKCSQNSLV